MTRPQPGPIGIYKLIMVILCCISMLVKFISNLTSLHCIIITQTLNELLVNLDTWIQENMKISVDVNFKQFISVKPVLLTNCGICFTMYISLIIWFISLSHCVTKHPVSLNKIYLPMPVFCHLHLVCFFGRQIKISCAGSRGGIWWLWCGSWGENECNSGKGWLDVYGFMFLLSFFMTSSQQNLSI